MAPLYNVLPIVTILISAWAPITNASLGAWDIKTGNDPNSCEAHMAELRTTYDESGAMVQAAREMIDLVRNGRKQHTRESAQETMDWDRTARLFTAIFGVEFDPSIGPSNKGAFDSVSSTLCSNNTKHWLIPLVGLYEQMSDVLAPDQPNEPPKPAKSHTGNLEIKPAIACGDGGWVFIDVDGEDLGDPAKRKLSESKQKDSGGPRYPGGVWFWDMRYFMGPKSTPQSVGICGHNINGVTQENLDLITLCDVIWGNPTLQQGKDSAHEDETTLDAITMNAPSRTLVHEFAHYFGFGSFQDPVPQFRMYPD